MARRKSPKNDLDVQAVSPGNGSAVSNPVENLVDNVALASPVNRVAKGKNGRSARRPGIVPTDSRANLIPINLDDEIRCLAYLLSERRGFEPGHETEDWLNAEREVLGRYEQQRA